MRGSGFLWRANGRCCSVRTRACWNFISAVMPCMKTLMKDPRTLLAYGRCSQEDELCAVCLHSRTAKGVRLGRTVFEMNDDLWDTYQTCLERQK